MAAPQQKKPRDYKKLYYLKEMNYPAFNAAGLDPFSTAPDPDNFYPCQHHLDCLAQLEISVMTRRGLSVIVGEVGTGKTTLCRQLIRMLSNYQEVETHLVSDPGFEDPDIFLTVIGETLGALQTNQAADIQQKKDIVRNHLLHKNVGEKKGVVLIIDEGQKLYPACLEILREFLNYETKANKLVQIVIFAQKEFKQLLNRHANFADRIDFYHELKPLKFRDTKAMIEYRLSYHQTQDTPRVSFSLPGFWAVFLATRGYPRKIINLCHSCFLTTINQEQEKIDWFLVWSCARKSYHQPLPAKNKGLIVALSAVAAALLFMIYLTVIRDTGIDRADIPTPSTTLQEEQAAAEPQDRPATGESTRPVMSARRESPRSTSRPPGPVPNPDGDTAAMPADHDRTDVATTASDDRRNTLTKPVTSPEVLGESLVSSTPGNRESTAVEPADTPSETQAMASLGAMPGRTDTSQWIPPDNLGQVVIQQGDFLCHLISRIYGICAPAFTRAVVEANTHLKNPENISAGQKITFPLLPVTLNPPAEKTWWLEIGHAPTLDEAFQLTRSTRGRFPLRIVPYYHPRTGLKYAVFINKYYPDVSTADEKAQSVSSTIGAPITVVTIPDRNTTYLVDPFVTK